MQVAEALERGVKPQDGAAVKSGALRQLAERQRVAVLVERIENGERAFDGLDLLFPRRCRFRAFAHVNFHGRIDSAARSRHSIQQNKFLSDRNKSQAAPSSEARVRRGKQKNKELPWQSHETLL